MKKLFLGGALIGSLVFALPSYAANINNPNLKEKVKLVKEDLQNRKMEILEKMCETRREISSRFPKLKVPKVCNKPSVEPPALEFSANSLLINEGESTTLIWQGENVISCEASGGWSGEKNVSGEEIISPLETIEYTLTCDGVEEGVEKSLVVEVVPLPEPVPSFDHLIISEVFYKGAAAVEWVEVYNDTGSDVDVSGWTISDLASTDTLPAAVIPNKKFAVIVGSTFDIPSLSLPVDTVVITLVGTNIGSGLNDTGEETVTLGNGVSVVDSLTYGTGEGAVPHVTVGQSLARKVPLTDTDSASDWEGATPTPGE